MTGGGSEDDRDSATERSEMFGAIDAGALREIRDIFVTMEPLVDAATLGDPLNPKSLSIELSDGVGSATSARFDVRWSVGGCYAFHYTDDEGRDVRFDRHPKPDAPTRHVHSPPDAPSRPVEPSCIAVTELPLVTRAVLKRWREAYEHGTLREINDAQDPP